MFSLGHSNLSINAFIGLLKRFNVATVADVRSSPYSGRAPWFNKKDFQNALNEREISYLFIGKELGGRPDDSRLYTSDIADYSKMAATFSYLTGLERLVENNEIGRVAMVCSEKDPLECHRCLLIGRSLLELGVDTCHIHHDGKVELQSAAVLRLLREERIPVKDQEWQWEERVSMAYQNRNMRVAYSTKNSVKSNAECPPKLI